MLKNKNARSFLLPYPPDYLNYPGEGRSERTGISMYQALEPGNNDRGYCQGNSAGPQIISDLFLDFSDIRKITALFMDVHAIADKPGV